MNIAAVIVTYNNLQSDFLRCIESLYNSGVTEIIVIDNSDSKQKTITSEMCAKFKATYLPQKSNHGFATSADIGARLVTSELIFFINPDAFLTTDNIKPIEQLFSSNLDIGIVGLPIYSLQGEPELNSYGSHVSPWSLITRHFVKKSLPINNVEVDWVSGGAMVIKTAVYKLVGGLDHQFFMYWEDVDLCLRVKQSGWQVLLGSQPIVKHRGGASFINNQQKTILYDLSADKYFCKHYAKSTCLLLRLLRKIYRLLSSLAVQV